MIQGPCHDIPEGLPLFSAARFVPRNECGRWAEEFEFLYIVANLGITAAYVAIPIILVFSVLSKETDVTELTESEHTAIRVAYSLFVLSCGVGHLEGVIAFRWPNYHAFAIWHALTAAVSWWAVAVTFRLRAKIVTGI